jgi:cytochrome c553
VCDELTILLNRPIKNFYNCRTCGGLKFLKAPGAPHLSSTVCNACHGRGRIQALEGVVPRQFVSRAQQIAGYLDTAMGDIAKQVRQARR